MAGADHARCVVSRSLSAPLGANTVPTATDPTIPTSRSATTTRKAGTRPSDSVPAHTIALFTITAEGRAGC